MKRALILIIFSLLFLGGCFYTKLDVRKVQLDNFDLVSTSRARVGLSVKVINNAKSSISLADVDGVIYKEGVPFANVSLIEISTIEGSSSQTIPIKLEVKITNPLLLLSTGLNIKKWESEDFTISGNIVLKSGTGLRKNFNIKSMPISKLANMKF